MPRGTDRRDVVRLQNRLWTPAALRAGGKLAAWWDMGQGPVTASANAISQVNDLSGKGNHLTQATAANKPTFDPVGWKAPNANLATATFDGTTSYMLMTASIAYSSTTGFSVHAAYQNKSTATYRTIICGTAQNSPQIRISNTDHVDLIACVQTDFQNATATLPTGWNVVGADTWGAGTAVWSNGLRETQTASVPTFFQPATAVGRNNNNSSEYQSGAIGEIVYCSTLLTLNEGNKVSGYLAWKWGTVGNLVASHPFKNRPPMIGD